MAIVNGELSSTFKVTLRRPQQSHPPQVMVYTDGSCLKNGSHNARSGAAIWFGENHPLNKVIRVPSWDQSNQSGELAAIAVALQSTHDDADLTIVTNSQYVIQTLTVSLHAFEDLAWMNIPNSKWLKLIAYLLRSIAAPMHFKWTKGHNGDSSACLSVLVSTSGGCCSGGCPRVMAVIVCIDELGGCGSATSLKENKCCKHDRRVYFRVVEGICRKMTV